MVSNFFLNVFHFILKIFYKLWILFQCNNFTGHCHCE